MIKRSGKIFSFLIFLSIKFCPIKLATLSHFLISFNQLNLRNISNRNQKKKIMSKLLINFLLISVVALTFASNEENCKCKKLQFDVFQIFNDSLSFFENSENLHRIANIYQRANPIIAKPKAEYIGNIFRNIPDEITWYKQNKKDPKNRS